MCIHRTSQAKTNIDNVTNRVRHSSLLLSNLIPWQWKCFCTGLCKWAHKSNLYSLRVLHRNLHPCEMVTGCSSTVSSRVPQFHTWSLRSTQRAQSTGVSARTKSEPTLTDGVCFKSLLHIWTWTLSGFVSASTPSELSWLWREAPTQAAGSPGAPPWTHRVTLTVFHCLPF